MGNSSDSMFPPTGGSGGQGPPGADGEGWTGGSYNAGDGTVTFTSDDGLGFSTSDLRGADGADGAQGDAGPAGQDGAQGDTGPQGPAGADGTTITFFQVQDDGTTGQLTTGSFADLAGMWDTPSLTDSDFSWNGTTGILTVNTAGTIEIDAKVTSWNNANNRHQLEIEIYKNGSTVLVGDSQYASRNNTQDEGSAYIHGFKDTASVNDTYRIRVLDVGVAATIGASQVSGKTYLSAKLYT